jgi:hypothetical protein
MQKGTLNPNIFKKAKQRFKVQGLSEVVVLQRASLDVGMGAIELPDGTKVSGGRVDPGEFTVTLQFSDDQARLAYLSWFEMAKDDGTERGIHPDYKRNAVITFLRAYSQPSNYDTRGNNLGPLKIEVIGCWCMKYVIPESDISSTDGDGYSSLECTLSYDDVRNVTDDLNSLTLATA